MTKRKRALLVLMALAVIMAVAVAAHSWKIWLETKLKAQLAAYGFPGVQFTIGAAGLHSITFESIAVAEQSPYRLQSLTVNYAPLELLHGTVRSLHAADAVIKQGQMNIRLDEAQIDTAAQSDGGMNGHWRISGININGAPLNLPVLSGEGTFTWKGDMALEGKFSNADSNYRAAFAFSLPQDEAKGAVLTVRSVQLPWNGGMLSVGEVNVPLAGTKPVELVLHLEKVSLQALLTEALAGKVTASGTVSGSVPVTLRRDGTFVLHKGTLKAEQAGTIVLSPDSIPGDNAQVAIVREVLKNFHYTTLSLALDSDPHDKLSILLSLAGNNPDAYNGREVRLNVHLSGDILDLLQQSVTSVTDTGRFLKEESHEKK